MSSCLKKSNKPYSLTKPLLLLTQLIDTGSYFGRCEVTKVAVSELLA